MTIQERFTALCDYVADLPIELRLLTAVKLYYAYFLTMDELERMRQRFTADFQVKDAQYIYKLAEPWFVHHSQIEKSNCDALTGDDVMRAPRPFIWDYDLLHAEFKEVIALIQSIFVERTIVDYSTGRGFGKDTGLIGIEWLEEYGLVAVDGVVLTRTTQPILINESPSEPILLALPPMRDREFTEQVTLVPSLGGGCAFKGLYGPLALNINYADAVGIHGVDTVMVYVGKIVAKDDDPAVWEAEPLAEDTRPIYTDVKRKIASHLDLEAPLVQL